VKLVLTSLLVFLPSDAQMACGMLVCGCYLVLVMLLRPYCRLLEERLHCVAYTELLLIFTTGLTLQNIDSQL
jgi:hypothetical protein